MPRYGYYCPNCSNTLDIVKPMIQSDTPETCSKCEHLMERDFNQRGIHCGNKSYGKPIISEALGIHPDQAAEHREHFPNIEVMPEGQLKFDNYQEHKKYLNKIGWDKQMSTRANKPR